PMPNPNSTQTTARRTANIQAFPPSTSGSRSGPAHSRDGRTIHPTDFSLTDNRTVIGGGLFHYRVFEWCGSGGMGDVYRAEDLQLRRVVALKVLRAASGTEGERRLLAEARAASALNHPNIAVVYEAGETEIDSHRTGYIAMEYVEGDTLTALIRRGPLDLGRVLDIIGQ